MAKFLNNIYLVANLDLKWGVVVDDDGYVVEGADSTGTLGGETSGGGSDIVLLKVDSS